MYEEWKFKIKTTLKKLYQKRSMMNDEKKNRNSINVIRIYKKRNHFYRFKNKKKMEILWLIALSFLVDFLKACRLIFVSMKSYSKANFTQSTFSTYASYI